MQKIRIIFTSPYMILVVFAVKLVTYYNLIGVNVFASFALVESMAVLTVMFISFSHGKNKTKGLMFLVLYVFFSVIMFADTMYYNYYNQTVSVRQLWQVSNVAKVPKSFVATLIPASFLVILDIPLIRLYFKKEAKMWKEKKTKKSYYKKLKAIGIIMIAYIVFVSINPMDSSYVKKLTCTGFFVNHVGDIYFSINDTLFPEKLPEYEVLKEIEDNKMKAVGTRLNGLAKGKNLIVIQMEAFQNFLIGEYYNGQCLTPRLNEIMGKDTIYFDNYYSTIGKGNTADAEFTSFNSLYPVLKREIYSLYQKNTFNGLPWMLKDIGYTTFAVHGYEGEFWNRREAYPYQGIDTYYAMEDLEDTEKIGLGISDSSMFFQAADIIKQQTGNYFAFINTLTNHHPFEMDEQYCEIELLEEHKETKFGAYLQTAHYADKAIGEFIDKLKAEGLYDNTIIAIYGDHHGLNYEMDDNAKIVGEFLEKEYDYDEMLKVPLIIHVPGSGVKEKISTLGGQIDFFPTISNLMGLQINNPYVLGQDIVNAQAGFMAFTAYLLEGSFAQDDVILEISREGTFQGSRAWKRSTGEELKITPYLEFYNKAIALKQASYQILEQDLISEYVDHEVKLKDAPTENPVKNID